VKLCAIEEVFATSDIVSCHLPLYEATTQLIDGALLRRMKPDSTFINTARGAVVNEPDLVAVLQERPDLYAVLDTIVEEPPAEANPLLQLPNVIVTPHLAGSMCLECRRMGRMMVDEFRRYVAGEPLLGEIREQDLMPDKIEWAKKHGIKVVPTVNLFHYETKNVDGTIRHDRPAIMQAAKADIERLKAGGVTEFQIDSEFMEWF
jgi:phosphoglycerate dehydrogenase-like enzyme